MPYATLFAARLGIRLACDCTACYHSGTGRSGEMADATVLKTVGGNPIRVRVPSPAPHQNAESRAPGYRARGSFFEGCESLAHRACSSRWARLAMALAFEVSSAWA